MLRVGALRNKGGLSALRSLSFATTAQPSGRPEDFQDVKDALVWSSVSGEPCSDFA